MIMRLVRDTFRKNRLQPVTTIKQLPSPKALMQQTYIIDSNVYGKVEFLG